MLMWMAALSCTALAGCLALRFGHPPEMTMASAMFAAALLIETIHRGTP